ncbi:MAG: DUF3267 domain-containing protein [Bacteroidales bacterium]
MKPTPEEITTGDRYKLIISLEYNEVAEFVLSQLKIRNPVILLFFLCTMALLIWAVALRIAVADHVPFIKLLPWSIMGLILFPIILIPIHEALHILIFLIFGGRDIRAGADIRNFIVYVTAHRHVVESRPFITIALFPFAVITSALVISLWYVTPEWQWSLSLTLLAHTTMCAGDFAMVAFYYTNSDKRILTWDDADNRIAYFYEDSRPATL